MVRCPKCGCAIVGVTYVDYMNRRGVKMIHATYFHVSLKRPECERRIPAGQAKELTP